MRSSSDRSAASAAAVWHPPGDIQINPLGVAFHPIDATWNARDVCSSFWRLYVNSRDGAWLELERGKTYRLAANQVHLVPAWVRFSCRNDRRIDHFYIHFDLMGLPGAIVRQAFAQPMTLGPAGDFQPMVDALRRRPWQDAGAAFAAAGQVQALAHLALSRAWSALSPAQAAACRSFIRGQHPFAPALEHIEQSLDQPLCNAELARLCHLSRDHFVRRFHACLGQTPTQYIRERRIARAAQRLLFTGDSIDEIAAATGFGDRFYFSRVFRQRMGVPPAAYRRAERVV